MCAAQYYREMIELYIQPRPWALLCTGGIIVYDDL